MTELLFRQSAPELAISSETDAALTRLMGGPQVAGHLSFGLVEELAAFQALESEWTALWAVAGRPGQAFQTYNWCWHWSRHYLGDGRTGPRLAIVTGRKAGRLVLLMPFVVEVCAGLRQMSWLGEPVSQYGDVLATADAADVGELTTAWRWAMAAIRPDVVNLRRVRSDAVAAPLLAALGSKITATEEAPFLTLGGDSSFAGWEERRQPRARKNRRRQARRLADQGTVTFQQHEGTAVAGALAARVVAMKREALDAKAAIALALSDERFQNFFSDAAQGLGHPAGVTVVALKSNDEIAALKILVDIGGASLLHVAVFDPRFEKCGVGALLLEHVVEKSIREGRSTLDLLPPRHEYKVDFADGRTLVHDHAIAVSTAGWLYTHAFLGLRRRAKAAIEAMPPPIRRIVARLAG